MTSSLHPRRRSDAEIIKLLKERNANGVTASAFCAKHGISKQTLYNWQDRVGSGLPTAPKTFIPVRVEPTVATDPVPFCDIIVSGKTTIRFFQPVDANFLQSLISQP